MVLLLPTVSADFQDIYEVNEATKQRKPAIRRAHAQYTDRG